MAKPKITPIGANILVEPITEKTTASGLVIPETVDKEKPQRGKVIALGKGDFKFNVKVGDEVLFKKYSPDELEYEDNTYLVMEETAILAVIG